MVFVACVYFYFSDPFQNKWRIICIVCTWFIAQQTTHISFLIIMSQLLLLKQNELHLNY